MPATKLSKKRGASAKLAIDPKLFTSGQWEEAFNVDGDEVLPCEQHHEALKLKPERDTLERILDLASYCRSKAENLAEDLGPEDFGGQDAAWEDDLIGAAEILERIAGVEPVARPKAVKLNARELATITAALCAWQHYIENPLMGSIRRIASNGEQLVPLTSGEINELAERMNGA